MIVSTRLMLAIVIVALIAAGCSAAATSPSPSPSPSPAASGALASSVATVTPTSTPPATLVPTVAPSVACTGLPQTGPLPSDRFTDLRFSTGADADRLTFVFGNASLPGPTVPPQGSLDVAVPPFTQAGSGAAIAIDGRHVVQVRFSGMSLANDVGQPTYAGPAEVKPKLAALRHAVLFDASEGIIGWYVGYDGSGCLTLVRDGNGVTLVIPHG